MDKKTPSSNTTAIIVRSPKSGLRLRRNEYARGREDYLEDQPRACWTWAAEMGTR